MFVDASAIVAMLTQEPEADSLADALERAMNPITSAIAIFEATLGLCRKRGTSVEEAQGHVAEFLALANIQIVPITDLEGRAALDAFARYGKGRGHPARLNLGECFAYAVARNHGIALLFKGNDFSETDVASAISEA